MFSFLGGIRFTVMRRYSSPDGHPVKYVAAETDTVVLQPNGDMVPFTAQMPLPKFMERVTTVFESGVGTAAMVMQLPGVVAAIRADIEALNPGIFYHGGLAGCISHAFSYENHNGVGYALALRRTEVEELLLYDLIVENVDFQLMGILYLNQALKCIGLWLGTHEQRQLWWNLLSRVLRNRRVNIPAVSFDGGDAGRYGAAIRPGFALLCTKLLQFTSTPTVLTALADIPMKLLIGFIMQHPLHPLTRYMRYIEILHAAQLGRPGESVAFEIVLHDNAVDDTSGIYAKDKDRGGMHSLEGSTAQISLAWDIYEVYVAEQAAAALELVKLMPGNGYLWHYLALFCPDVPTVTIRGMDERGVERDIERNCALEAAMRVDSAFAASGIAKAHWTRHAHAYGNSMVPGSWPDIPSVGGASALEANDVPSRRTQISERLRVNPPVTPGGHRLTLGIRSEINVVIAVYLMAKTRLWREGRLNPGPEVHTAVEEDTLEMLDFDALHM